MSDATQPASNEEERFRRIRRLPPYVFNIVNQLKVEARRAGEDIIDLGMGNPDLGTPPHIVEKLVEAAQKPQNHRYSVSRGIYKLRLAICDWYKRKYDVDLDPDTEAIATMGAKEGLAHLMLAVLDNGDLVFAPTPTYPIHAYSVIIAGGDMRGINITKGSDFFGDMEREFENSWPRPKGLIMSFPHNPTTACVDLEFFERVVDFAKRHNIWVVHDLAYSDLVFDGYEAPSILQVPGAKDVAVELYSMSKGYSMPGWRVAFCVGNTELVHALTRIKSYLDYGMFQPIQIAAIIGLNGPTDCVADAVNIYKERRDVLCEGLARVGWEIPKPQATMFVWAEIPEQYRAEGSLEFAKRCLKESGVAVSPGIGFGPQGDGHVRFALVENEQRIRQAVRGLKNLF